VTWTPAKRSEQPPPPEPEGFGDVLTIQFGQTHLVDQIHQTPGDGQDVALACSSNGSAVRIDKHTQPPDRFRLQRANLNESISCVTCRQFAQLGDSQLDSAE
jgi:hypothetical protein